MIEEFSRWVANASRLDLSIGGANPAKTPLYIGEVPHEPANALHHVFIDTGGSSSPDRLLRRSTLVQVLTRSIHWETAKDEAERAYTFLHGLNGYDISGWFLCTCRAIAPPQLVGRDAAGMVIYSTNYEVITTKDS